MMLLRLRSRSPLWLATLFVAWTLLYCAVQASEEETCVVEAEGSTSCETESVGHARNNDSSSEDPQEAANEQQQQQQDTNDNSAKNEIILEETKWSVAQVGLPDFDRERILHTARVAQHYMEGVVYRDEAYESVREDCRNQNEHCLLWASQGECDKNPNYMKVHCAPACQTCEQVSFQYRCPFDADDPGVWGQPGDVNRFFERLTTDPIYEKYQPTIHSRPKEEGDGELETDAAVKDGPWLVTLENFLLDEECERLIELGHEQGFKQSKAESGKRNFDGTYESIEFNQYRTSSNTWCVNECYYDPLSMGILQRLENVTGLPEPNAEFLQLLRYEESEFYTVHHDVLQHHVERPEGLRILTVFMYLNDVEEGGGTNFPSLDITVTPKRGRAVLWPNVKDENPTEQDSRTRHQSLPVTKGVKYGANAWYHQRDFKEAFARGCSD